VKLRALSNQLSVKKQRSLKSKSLYWLLTTVWLIIASSAGAQPTKKVWRLGVLYTGLPGIISLEAFRRGLRELGYEETKNIAIEYRFAEGKLDRLPNLAAELVELKVDVIVAAGGTPAILAAKNATNTIPIVFPTIGDPVALGIVASLARPGGNITGLTIRTPEFSGKRLELLKEVVPRAIRVAVLGNEANPSNGLDFKNVETASSTLGVALRRIEVRSPSDFDNAFAKMTSARADALFILADPMFQNNGRRLADLATKSRLPTIYDGTELPEAGILMSYGASRSDLYRRAATYVDKILKGAKPAELPVEQPTKFEFVINLKTAKQIGLTIPPNVLARADKVIR
jgi:putative tryptophan/tyrosine transport system substrate-binding protein